jgi:histidinol-phosphate aminotransferase
MNLQQLLRENIRNLKPYSSARDEYKGKEAVFLDANENPFDTGYNRYPDPYQWALKARIGEIKFVAPENIFLGNGSDEGIDLLVRAFCEPHQDNIITIDPSYGMYQVCADTHAIEVRKVLLNDDFSLNVEAVLAAVDQHSKLLFVCSPNNPTANNLATEGLKTLLESFHGIVVIDEAYIDFSPENSALPWLASYDNLVVLQTFSKAWGFAGIRLGMAFGSQELIRVINKIKMPYNINALTQAFALKALEDLSAKEQYVASILQERERMMALLPSIPCITKVYPSDANFILVKTQDADVIYQYLIDRQIVVRNRSKVALCGNCLRLTVGTALENEALMKGLRGFGS